MTFHQAGEPSDGEKSRLGKTAQGDSRGESEGSPSMTSVQCEDPNCRRSEHADICWQSGVNPPALVPCDCKAVYNQGRGNIGDSQYYERDYYTVQHGEHIDRLVAELQRLYRAYLLAWTNNVFSQDLVNRARDEVIP